MSEAGCRLVEDKAAPFPRCCAREECEEVAETVARAARRIIGNIASEGRNTILNTQVFLTLG